MMTLTNSVVPHQSFPKEPGSNRSPLIIELHSFAKVVFIYGMYTSTLSSIQNLPEKMFFPVICFSKYSKLRL